MENKIKVRDIADYIEELAPRSLAEKWDNPGLSVGDFDAGVSRVYVSLDATSQAVDEAVKLGAELIVTHHPLIFTPIRRVVEQDVTGGIIKRLIENKISLYSAHTNLDIADGGMNDILCEKLGLVNVRHFTDDECFDDETGEMNDNIGRVGMLDTPMELADFSDFVRNTLGCAAISCVGNPSDVIRSVAVCSGSGGDYIKTAYNAGSDVYVTSEVKHHQAIQALELGMTLIDAGHFETENIVCDFMEEYLLKRFDSLTVFKSSATPYKHR